MWLLVVLMLVGGPVADVIAQRAPERPAPERPARREPEKPTEKPTEKPKSCCRICSKGKACGKSCIARALTCHKPPGCACDASSQ